MAGEGAPGSGPDRPPDQQGGQPDQARPEPPPSPPPSPPSPPDAPQERAEPRPADRPGQSDRPDDHSGDRPGWSHREPGADKDTARDQGGSGSPLAPRGADKPAAKPEGEKPTGDKPDGDKPDTDKPDPAKEAADKARQVADEVARAKEELARAKESGGWSPDRGRPAFAKPPDDKGGKTEGPKDKGDKTDKGDGGKDKGDKQPGRVRDIKERIDRVGGPHKYAGRIGKEALKHIGERSKDIPKDVGKAALRKSVEAGRAAKAKARDLGKAAVKKSVEGVKEHIRKGIEKIPADGKTYDQRASDAIHKAFKEMRQEHKQNRADKKEFIKGERAAYKQLRQDGIRSKRQVRDGKPGSKHPHLHPIRMHKWKSGERVPQKWAHHHHGVSYQDQVKHGTPHPADIAKSRAEGPKHKPGFHPELTRHQKKWHPDNQKKKK